MSQKPETTIRLGRVKASVWKNETEQGAVRFNVQIVKVYRQDDEWKQTTNFGREDLPLVAKVADMAHTWCFQESQNAD